MADPMTPYYSDDLVTIYHGDALELLPTLAAAAVVTDPPYGVAFRGAEWDAAIPAGWLALATNAAPVALVVTGQTTLWSYPPADWVLCWGRAAAVSHSGLGTGFSHWTPVLVYGRPYFPVDVIALHAIGDRGERQRIAHPTPKPLALMRWLVAHAAADDGVILDPFAGSGSTLVAAKSLGRRAIGIDIEERYCEIAAQRCAQEVLGLSA